MIHTLTHRSRSSRASLASSDEFVRMNMEERRGWNWDRELGRSKTRFSNHFNLTTFW